MWQDVPFAPPPPNSLARAVTLPSVWGRAGGSNRTLKGGQGVGGAHGGPAVTHWNGGRGRVGGLDREGGGLRGGGGG